MEQIHILVVGREPDILATVVRLINTNPDWSAKGAQTDEEAIALFDAETFRMVLFGGGIDPVSEQKLRDHFSNCNPHVPVVQHYGGGSGLLSNEIIETLAQA